MKYNINKLSLPVTILIASIILGGFYYASQAYKQKSIERQQENAIEQKKQEQLVEQEKIEREILEKCGKIAHQNYKLFQAEWNRSHSAKDYSHFSEISIHFNKKLNLCIYEGGVANDVRWEINIFNAYTNEVLTNFVSFDGPSKWNESTKNWYDEFNKNRTYYFEEK